MLTQQQKEDHKDIESFDFFKKTPQKKPTQKTTIKQVVSFILFLQFASIISYISEIRTHINYMKGESIKTIDIYSSYKDNLEHKNYKEALYKLHDLFTQETSTSNLLALVAVNGSIFNSDAKYPDSFIKESMALAKEYHHKGVYAEITRDKSIHPCWSYDLVCQVLFYPMKESFKSHNDAMIEQINEGYYKLDHIKEYKEYYKKPITEWSNIQTPYQQSKYKIPF